MEALHSRPGILTALIQLRALLGTRVPIIAVKVLSRQLVSLRVNGYVATGLAQCLGLCLNSGDTLLLLFNWKDFSPRGLKRSFLTPVLLREQRPARVLIPC